MEFTLKKENKIYLFRCNIKIKQFSDKLNYKKLKSFKIKKILNLVNYRLLLLKTINIYLIFYISLFKLIPFEILKASIIKINPVNLNVEYEIKIILNC